jgi:hypothetical protein
MRVPSLAVVGLFAGAVTLAAQSLSPSAPETFTANAQVKGPNGAAAATIQIHVQRYTPDFDRKSVETALKSGGYPAFLTALRKAPDVGYIAVGDNKWAIRYARERAAEKGRTIVVVTEKPVFFVGGGQASAKPRAGYEVAVALLQVDDVGLGSGTMAAAARVKPGADAGVQIDDYADEPIKLVTVSRKIK